MSNTMTRPQLSFYNPFRTPLLTPNLTGASVTSSAPSYHTALPFSHTLLTPTPTGMSTVSRAPSYQTVAEADSHSDDEDVPEVLPELTPRMPSRQITSSPPQTPPSSPPPFDLPPDLTPDDIPESAPPAYSLTPNVGGGETIVEQGPRRPFQRAPEPTQPTQPPPPPPAERPPSQMSDFARDFYAAGTEPFPPVPPSPAAPLQQQRQYAPPPGPPPPTALVQQQTRYAPPPGAPPPTRRPSSASTSSGAGSTSSLARDGHPTTTPTPGRPLLRNGRTLIYPETYFCPKCRNTGYKNFDPLLPCRKCWNRFSKPFSSILASSPWGDHGSDASSQSQHGRTFQRPLPAFKPPQTFTTPRPPPPPLPGVFVPPRPPPPRPGPAVVPSGSIPPPGATVVMPGDSRIGGRLCWRCGGRGMTPFLFFDEMPCETCGGVGRLFSVRPQNCSWNCSWN